MTNLIAQTIKRHAHAAKPMGRCTLNYDDRFLRRKMLATDDGVKFLVDLEGTESLNQGDAFVLGNGQMVEVVAADEDLLRITGNLTQLAWHIGNRHTPCQIEQDHLLIQADPVIGHMLEHLGASVQPVVQPFTPEGGAYGHGRTHSHEHVATAHDHH